MERRLKAGSEPGFRLAVLGADRRLGILREMLINNGHAVFGYDEWNGGEAADAVICPIPMTRDGVSIAYEGGQAGIETLLERAAREGSVLIAGSVPEAVADKARGLGAELFDVMDDDEMAVMNAIPTAEGAIAAAMEAGDITIFGSECLVLGYGRCGRALCRALKGLGANVAAAHRTGGANIRAAGVSPVDIARLAAHIGEYDFIFNTVPAPVLGGAQLAAAKKSAVIIDIASAPGGVDFDAARELGVTARLCPGLPGKVAPRSAAAAFYESVMRVLVTYAASKQIKNKLFE